MDKCKSIPDNFHINEGSGCFFESVAQVLAQIKPSELNITGDTLFKQCNTSITIQMTNQLPFEEAENAGRTICENYNVRLHIIKIQNKDGEEICNHKYVDKYGAKAMQCNCEDDDMIHILFNYNDFRFKPILRLLNHVPKTTSSSKPNGYPKLHDDFTNAIKSNGIITLKELLKISPNWLLEHFPYSSQTMDLDLHIREQMHCFLDESFGLQKLYVSMEDLSKTYVTENELLDVICASLETFKTYADYFLVKKGLRQHRMNLVFFSLIAERYENWMQIRINQQNGVEISRKTLKEIQLHLTKLLFPLDQYNKLFSTKDKLRIIRQEYLKSHKHPFSCWETYRKSVTETEEMNTIYQTYRFGQSQYKLVNALSDAFNKANNKTLPTTQATTVDSKPYLIMKDIYVLDRILHYIDLALSKGLYSNEVSYVDQLVLERALQVTGEYMKNTDETPNLSEDIQIKLAAAGVQIKLLTEVRNMLSHYTSKQVFSEINVNDRILLENVHKDLEKVRGVILKVLRQVKINQVQNLLCNDESIPNNAKVEVVTQIKHILEDIKLSMSKHDIKLSFEKLMSILKEFGLSGDIDMTIHEILCVILPDIIQERMQLQNEILVTKSEIFQQYHDHKFGIYDHDWTDCKSVITNISSLKEIEKFKKTKLTDSNNSRNLHDLSLASILVKVIMEEALVKKDFKAIIVKLKYGFQADLDTAKLKEKNSSSNTLFLDAISEIANSKLDDQLNYFLEKFLEDSDLNDLQRLMKVQETQKQDFQNLLNKFRVQIATIVKSTQVIDNILIRVFDSISKLAADIPETTLTEEHFEMLNTEVENKRLNRIAKMKLTILCGGIKKVPQDEFDSLVSKFKCNVQKKVWDECYKNRRKCNTILDREVSDPYDKLVNAMEKGLDLNGMKQSFINFIESLQIGPKSATTYFKQKTEDAIEAIFEENFEKQFNDTLGIMRKLMEEIENYDDNESQNEHYPRWKTNERLKAALEMAILKALNTLSVISTPKVGKKLEKLIHTSVGHIMENTFNYTPLRNYLAHGDAMIDMRNTKMRDYLRIFAGILIQNGRAIIAVNRILNNTKNCSFLQTILEDENLIRVVEQNPEIFEKEIQIIMESEYWKNNHWKTDLLNTLKQESTTEDAKEFADFSFSEFIEITKRELLSAVSFGDLRSTKFFLNHTVENCDKFNFLHFATENGNLDVLRFLLEQGFQVNVTDQINYTPLHYAVLNQNTEAARCLLENNANARARDDHGYTPLHIAAFSGATDIILLLHQHGAKVHEVSESKATPLLLSVWNGRVGATQTLITEGALANMSDDYLSRLAFLAADEGHDQIMQSLLIGGVKIDSSVANSWTPLHQATRKGHLKVVNLLIGHGANVSVEDADDVTPLHLAHSTPIAEALINAGADINCLSNLRTPLHVAVGEGASQVVQTLLQKGANIDARTKDSWLVSHIAASNGYVQIMEFLLEAGASVNSAAFLSADVRRNVTPLYLACLYGHSDMVSFLLQNNANANDISYEIVGEHKQRFEWPLQIAIAHQYFEMADILLEHGVDIAIVDDNDLTALHYASYYGPLNVVQKLLERGSNIDAVTKDSKIPVYCAAYSGSLDIIQLLIDQGADLDHMMEGETLLHLAVRIQKPKVVDLLLKNGFKINAEGKLKRTALHLACIVESNDEDTSNDEIMHLLLHHEANVNAADFYNDTPLHFATKVGSTDAVIALMKSGANPNAVNNANTTPLQIAKQQWHDECYVFMVNNNSNTSNMKKQVNQNTHTHLPTATRCKTVEPWIKNLCREVISGNDSKDVQDLLINKMHASQIVDLNNYQLLHICVLRKNDAILNELLAYGFNIDHLNNEGLTPLHLAIQTNNQEAVSSLLKAGADVNSLTRDTAHSALHLAIQNEVIDILKILLGNENIVNDIANLNDETPLTLACQMGRLDIVNLLINHECKIIWPACDRDTPLHVAVKYNQNQIVETLFTHGAIAQAVGKMGNHPLHYSIILDTMLISQMLIDHDADVNCLNDEHFTPLHIATQQGNGIAVEFLLKKMAKVDGIEENVDTPLHLAVDKGHWNIMELLIKNNANVNAINGQKQTPLHLAAIKGDYAMVEYLLDNKANIEIPDESKCTPLFLAVKEGHYDLVKLLKENGARINSTWEDGTAIIHQAVQTSDVAMVEEVLKNGGNINFIGKNGWTPLHLAIDNDCLNIVKLLLEWKAKINVPDNVNEFPIHVACKTGNHEITKMLIEAGANVNCCNEKGRTPLIIAIQYQRETCMKILLENHASMDTISPHGQHKNALHVAIANVYLEAVTMLIESGADINITNEGLSLMHSAAFVGSVDILEKLHHLGLNVDALGTDDNTPLHVAVTAGHAHCVSYLLAAEANINATNKTIRATPFSLAIFLGMREIAGILIKNGANVDDFNNGQKPPLHLAAEYGYADIVQLLLDNGANMKQLDNKGFTALHHAIGNGHLDAAKVFLQDNFVKNSIIDIVNEPNGTSSLMLAIQGGFDEIAIELINKGANVNLTDRTLNSPLMEAITKKFLNVIHSLIEHGADVNAVNSEQGTALHVAIEENNLEAVQYLLEKEANIDVKLHDDNSLLHFAASHGNAAIIRHLLKSGLDVNAICKLGKTPLHVSAYEGHGEAVHVLLDNGAKVNSTDNLIRTPLHLVAIGEFSYPYTGHAIEIARKKEEFFSAAKSLIRKGVIVDATDKNMETALHIAANLGLIKLVKLLLETANANGKVNVNRNTPLHLAAKNGHVEIIKLLLDKGADVDRQTDSGVTPLLDAIYTSELQAVKTLLHYGASTTASNTSYSILHTAALNGNVKIIKLILEHLPFETNLTNYLNAVTVDGLTPLSIATVGGHKEATELFLLIGADGNNPGHISHPLHLAACEGHSDILELLLNHECKLDQKDNNENTALHLASSQGHLKVVELLLRRNARESTPNIIDNLNDQKQTALLLSIIEKYEDIAIALIEAGVDLNKVNFNGDSPLMTAISKHLPNVVRKLINQRADVNVVNNEYVTALHFAILENDSEMLHYLAENGANVKVRRLNGNTLLHYALLLGKIEMIPHLLKFGLVNVANAEGRTPLHYACHKGYANTVALLLQNGADVNAKDNCIRTALHYVVLGMSENAFDREHVKNEKQMDEFLLAAESLLLKGVDVNVADEKNQTTLHYAVYQGFSNLVKLLLENNANANGNEVEGVVPLLHCAAEYGYAEITQLLINKGAIVDQVNHHGMTSLLIATCEGHVNTAKVLLECGASTILNNVPFSILHAGIFKGNMAMMKLILENLLDEKDVNKEVNAKDQNGNSPLICASEFKYPQIAQLLLMIGADVNAVNNKGWSALHLAANLGQNSLVLTLLDYGSDVNLKCNAGKTALYLAVRNSHLEVVQILLQNNANVTKRSEHDTILHAAISSKNSVILKLILDNLKSQLRFDDYLNAKDGDGDTPLMWAVEDGNLEAAKTLLLYGAKVDVKNDDGVNALDWAYKKKHNDIIDLLKNV